MSRDSASQVNAGDQSQETTHTRPDAFLHSVALINNCAAASVRVFLAPIVPLKLTREQQSHASRVGHDLGFNLFTLVSDLYYRENFHSNLLRALLGPANTHGEGDKYLRLFIALLQRI